MPLGTNSMETIHLVHNNKGMKLFIVKKKHEKKKEMEMTIANKEWHWQSSRSGMSQIWQHVKIFLELWRLLHYFFQKTLCTIFTLNAFLSPQCKKIAPQKNKIIIINNNNNNKIRQKVN
jgi:hypothetical protein